MNEVRAQVDPSKQMFDMLVMGRTLPLIYVVAKLGIADLLKNGPKPVTELAQETHSLKEPLYRALRALCAVGIFEEKKGEMFSLTPLGQTLRGDSSKSVRGLAVMFGCPYFWKPWGELSSAVVDGSVPFERCFGEEFFSYLSKDSEANRIFNEAMTSSSDQTNETVVASYDFSKIKTCVDVGGGRGALAKAIVNHYPQLDVAVFESSAVTKDAGFPSGVRPLTGDFFKAAPEGFDVYLLQKIIHDWGDKEAVQILSQIRQAIEKSKKLLIIESVLRQSGNSLTMLLKDIEMLIMTKGGRERTESEFRKLLSDSGFRVTRILETGTSLSIIEAVPV